MQDRVPLYPGRVTLTPVSGQTNTFDMVRADQPTQEGTPLNKANLFSDETAAKYPAGTETVDGALGALGAAAVYDGSTLKTLLGNNVCIESSQISGPSTVKLLEVEDTVGGVEQIDVDLSGISLQDYRYLDFEFRIAGIPTHSAPRCRALLNNITESNYYRVYTYDNSAATRTTNYLFEFYTPKGTPPFTSSNSYDVYSRIRLWGTEHTIFAECGYSYFETSSQFYYSTQYATIERSVVTPSTLSSINFMTWQGVMEAGSWIKVYGVRK